MTAHEIVDDKELQKQIAYAEDMSRKGLDGFVAPAAFIESMRNTYYTHTGTAIDELIDNAIEAGATAVHIVPGYYGKSTAKPDALAIIDNGHGMVKQMLSLAVMWGGTHREGSRSGLGRFGFGLPNASVNQGRRFTVYSKTRGAEWMAVTIDLDDIKDGKYHDKHGRIVRPDVTAKEPPKWVLDYILKEFAGGQLNNGTIVLWEKLDRLSWSTISGLTRNLLEHFGVTFREYLKYVDIYFDTKRVEPTDPLFITPGMRYYDLDEDKAEARPAAVIEVAIKPSVEEQRAEGGGKIPVQKVPLNIRYAAFPPSFFSVDKEKDAKGSNQNNRMQVAKENAGILVCRMGRQIAVLEGTPWEGFRRFRNDDRYWGMEIDFPAELDEEFTIANNKQGVMITERIWNILKDNGALIAIRQLRKDYESARKAVVAVETPADGKRLSEKAMEDSAKFQPKRARKSNPEREEQARAALEQFVKQQARKTNRPVQEVKEQVEQEGLRRPYQVEFESLPGAPFFRTQPRGGIRVLLINQQHRFYGDLYASDDSTPFVRAALETLLFSIGECELEAGGSSDRSQFYTVERREWSIRLDNALASLDRYVARGEINKDDDSAAEGDGS